MKSLQLMINYIFFVLKVCFFKPNYGYFVVVFTHWQFILIPSRGGKNQQEHLNEKEVSVIRDHIYFQYQTTCLFYFFVCRQIQTYQSLKSVYSEERKCTTFMKVLIAKFLFSIFLSVFVPEASIFLSRFPILKFSILTYVLGNKYKFFFKVSEKEE